MGHAMDQEKIDPVAPAGELGRIVAEMRIEKREDALLLRRLLAAVAKADAHLDAEERRFFSVFASTADMTLADADLDRFAVGPAPSPDEIRRLSPALREPAYVLANALAWTDEQLAPEEAWYLEALAGALELAQDRRDALDAAVRGWLLEQELIALYASGPAPAEEYANVRRFASRLGVETADFDRLEEAFLARQGWLERRGTSVASHPGRRPARIRGPRVTARGLLAERDRADIHPLWPTPPVVDVRTRFD